MLQYNHKVAVVGVPDVVVTKPVTVSVEPTGIHVDVGDKGKRNVGCTTQATVARNSRIGHNHESRTTVFYLRPRSPLVPPPIKLSFFENPSSIYSAYTHRYQHSETRSVTRDCHCHNRDILS